MLVAEMKYEKELDIQYYNSHIVIYDGKIQKPYNKALLETIKGIKGYKYFIDDCIRFSQIDIIDYLIELTYDSIIEWDTKHDAYTTEYGIETYNLNGNNLSFEVDKYIKGDLILHDLYRLKKAIDRMKPDYRERISIYDLVVKCSYKQMDAIRDEIYPIDTILLVDNREYTIKAYYSRTKDEYFAYRRDFEFDGNPYCKVLDYKEYIKDNYNYEYDLNPQSIMYLYGYNASDNMSEKQRQDILVFLMESRIMSWFEIIEHLQFLIEFHGRLKHNNAVSIWERDIGFIRKYKGVGNHRLIISDRFIQRKK